MLKEFTIKKLGLRITIYKLLLVISFIVTGSACNPYFLQNSSKSQKISHTSISSTEEILSVCFTPNDACLPKVIQNIADASLSIFVLGYSFTSQPIAKALIAAKNRGILVRMVLDSSQKTQKSSKAIMHELVKSGIDLRFDHSVKIAHNKILIIDSSKVLTGSYNWTHAAEFKNAENIVFINSQKIAKEYIQYFEARWKIAKVIN